MRVLIFVRTAAVALACLNLVLPLPQLCAAPPPGGVAVGLSTDTVAGPIRDVSLERGGALSGQVLDRQGKPEANQVVLILQDSKLLHRAMTDSQGRFVIPQIRAGVYLVAAGNSITFCRCWATGTAPPAAQDQILLVSDTPVERGQRPIGEVLGSPLLIGLIIAAAIAIPIAVHNSKKDAS